MTRARTARWLADLPTRAAGLVAERIARRGGGAPPEVTGVDVTLLKAGRWTGRPGSDGLRGGALTTLGLLGARDHDVRVTAAIELAGSLVRDEALAPPGVPLLVFQGRADRTVRPAATRALYARVPHPKALVELRWGSHSAPLSEPHYPRFPVVLAPTTESSSAGLSREMTPPWNVSD